MGIDVKSIIQLGIEIGKFTPLSPFMPAASKFADMLPGSSKGEREMNEIEWKVINILRWKAMVRQLMDIPMEKERKGKLLRGRIAAEFFDKFGEDPKDEWIEDLHTSVVRSVKAFMATEGLG